ncbi:Triple Functional Domain Protein [Manis pentadactyla]|nr:Triple Functional Domain Protein [Manis pentadactyla]
MAVVALGGAVQTGAVVAKLQLHFSGRKRCAAPSRGPPPPPASNSERQLLAGRRAACAGHVPVPGARGWGAGRRGGSGGARRGAIKGQLGGGGGSGGSAGARNGPASQTAEPGTGCPLPARVRALGTEAHAGPAARGAQQPYAGPGLPLNERAAANGSRRRRARAPAANRELTLLASPRPQAPND